MVVDWVSRKIQINAPHLQQLLNAISRPLEQFTSFNIAHVYRELNSEADILSKQAINDGMESIKWAKLDGTYVLEQGSINIS